MGVHSKQISIFQPTNIAFIVENEKLYVNKQELITHSSVFRNMFRHDFIEKDLTEIKLPGKKLDAFSCFLRCLLPGIGDEISVDNVHKVLPLAHEYQAEILLQKIDNLLASNCSTNGDTSLTDVIENINEAETYDLEQYLKANRCKASKCYLDIVLMPTYKTISVDSKLAISKIHWQSRDDEYASSHKVGSG